MPTETTETLIIGAGQAGIAMSHQLTLRGRAHVVLERHRVAERWRSERWDGLRFQFPNWIVGFKEFPFPCADPDGFASAPDIADYIEAYARFADAPVRCGVTVTALRPGFGAETTDGLIEARNVVVATGPYQRPVVPAMPGLDILQAHSRDYRNPAQLPEGAVLVVGSGASGAQIAEELMRVGRRVYLSIGRHRRFPRRYRGRDLFWWWRQTGAMETQAANKGTDPSPVLLSGAYGGHTIDFRGFAAQGMVLLGRTLGVRDGVLSLGADLAANLAHGDAAYRGVLDAFDAFAAASALDLPEDPVARAVLPDPACVRAPIRELDLRAAGVSAVIWATGYGFDYGWLKVPVLDGAGAPVHRAGVSEVPGLYFLGLPWMTRMPSAFLVPEGMGRDAADIAERIVSARQTSADDVSTV